jgi:gamma-glutamyl hercynylcysteine S-oxide hydrolase
MCRLVSFVSKVPVDAAPFLAHVARLSLSGNLVDRWEKRPGGNHPDGWGVAYREGEAWKTVRSGVPAGKDPLLRDLSMRTDRFIGHVRYASDTATVSAGNAHPFLVDGLALAHNGTFRGCIGREAENRNVSDTLVFAERLAAEWPRRTLDDLGLALSRMLTDRDLIGEYSAANLLIASGTSIFALRRFRKEPDYYTLVLRAGEDRIVAASEPLDDDPAWRPLSDGEIVELSLPAPRSLILTGGL